VTWGFRPRTELEAAAPDAVCDAPGELVAALLV
jgi:phosphoglycolate phosphatase-like HAD superfamily hydrolase